MSDIMDWIDVRSYRDPLVERALLGMALHARRIPPALQMLQSRHFRVPGHETLWAAIRALHENDPRAELKPTLLLAQMEQDAPESEHWDYKSPKALAYLHTLADLQPGLDMARLYVGQLLDAYNKIHLWAVTVRLLQQLYLEHRAGVSAQVFRKRIITDLQALDFSGPYQKAATWADLQALARPVEWDWPGWLPRGHLVLLGGQSGMGKSLLALRLAACYLRGDPWPDGSRPAFSDWAVLWCESEAAQFLNLQRARAWGLPNEQIRTPLRATHDVDLELPAHRSAVARRAAEPGVRLIVVDSLSGAGRAAGQAQESMGTVRWLAHLARDTRKPVLLLHHLHKRSLSEGASSVRLEDLRGHSSIVQPARIVIALDAPDPAHPQIKRLSVIKSNLAALPPPLGFYIAGGAGASSPALCGSSTQSGAHIRFCDPPQPPQATTLLEHTIERLRDLLSQGPLPVSLIHEQLAQLGISKRTTHRAKAHLGIRSSRKDDHWLWLLPSDAAQPPLLDSSDPE